MFAKVNNVFSMSLLLAYSDEFNRKNLALVSKLNSLPADKLREAWRVAFEQKMLNPAEFVVFLDWMPDYLSEMKVKKHIKTIIYTEMERASHYLKAAWKEITYNGSSINHFFVRVKGEETVDLIHANSVSPFLRDDFGWEEVTKLGEAIGLLENGAYALSNIKKSAFTGLIECLVSAKLIENLPLYLLQDLFGRHYHIIIKTDRLTNTRTDYCEKAKRKLPKLFPYIY